MSKIRLIDLLKTKRFYPLFWAQSATAFQYNILLSAFQVYMTYVLNLKADDISFVSLLNSVIFTLPYFLFSGSFGQYADSNCRSTITKKLKFIELLLISYMIIAILFKNYYLYAVGLFFLGAQATFFGTVKYGMLPEYLEKHELVPGNSAIEGSTFIAITTGMLTGTVIISTFSEYGTYIVSVLLFLLRLHGLESELLKIPTIHVKGSTGNELEYI